MLGRLHVITDAESQTRFTHLELASLAIAGGADVVQFREKRSIATAELVRIATEIEAESSGSGRALIVNDRVDVAAAARAGVHLGRDDLDVRTARRLLGRTATIGVTANDLDEALVRAKQPADYLGVGPVYGTTSKSRPAPRMGIERFAKIAARVALPVVAIGGITASRIPELLDAGAHGVAVLSAVAGTNRPDEATDELRRAIDRWTGASAGEGRRAG